MECTRNRAPRTSEIPLIRAITFPRPSGEEIHVTAVFDPGKPLPSAWEEVAAAIRRKSATIISQDVFGLEDGNGAGLEILREAFGQVKWPVTWLEDGAPGLAGTQIWAVSGVPVHPVFADGTVVGSVFEDDSARYCRLGGVYPRDARASRKEQAHDVFFRLEQTLETQEMTFSDIVRTWFFNEDILSWYSDFNQVRTAFFARRAVFNRLVPASTGIGGRNPLGAALVAGLLAVQEKTRGHLRAFAVPSPLQCPALEYGSSFSRAVEIATPGSRRLLISGTASIDAEGHTVHVGDLDGQIDMTMRVVGAILSSRGMTWRNAARAVVYLLDLGDAPAFHRYCAAQNLESLPAVFSRTTVCRRNLLFEIEVDALHPLPLVEAEDDKAPLASDTKDTEG